MKKTVIKNASGISICSFLLVSLFVFFSSCSKIGEDDFTMDDESSDLTLKSHVVYGDYYLEGTSNFDCYAVKEHRVVSDGNENFLLMKAKLTHVSGHKYLLETEESLPLPDGSEMLFRKISFDVKITHGGFVMFSWPETWWELGEIHDDVLGQLLEHTGCVAHGPGTNRGTLIYRGRFDGSSFYAATRFMGKQINPEPVMELYWHIDGPAKFNFSINLQVAECPSPE
jgi:hypothetical protein